LLNVKRIIIAIDGSSGCGKSSTAKAVARALGYTYVDSGAMYRATTLYFLDHGIDPEDSAAVSGALSGIVITFQVNDKGHTQAFLNGENCEDRIREMRVAKKVSTVSAVPAVRRAMVALQREMGKERGIVMDGRDIGTVVYPDAELKIFLTASLEVRGRRRQLELKQKGQDLPLADIIDNLEKRDLADSTRAVSPLRKAQDAIEIDTSDLPFDAQVEKVLNLARKVIQNP